MRKLRDGQMCTWRWQDDNVRIYVGELTHVQEFIGMWNLLIQAYVQFIQDLGSKSHYLPSSLEKVCDPKPPTGGESAGTPGKVWTSERAN